MAVEPVVPLTLRDAARRTAAATAAAAEAAQERCDLCGEAVPDRHRHLLELDGHSVQCVCLPCSVLFERGAAAMGRVRLIPDRRLRLVDFRLDDLEWSALRIPVGIAFLVRNGETGRVQAAYPSPAGGTESDVEVDGWQELVGANPVLDSLELDVEALLVNRARGARDHFIVPIDDCFRLVAVVRTTWRGLSGGSALWREVEAFFESLTRRARAVTADGARVQTPRAQEVTT